METNQNMEERLWSYIDGQLPIAERPLIERLLETDAAWRAKYNELLEVNELLQSSELDAPSMRFTRNVMEEISRMHIAPATRTYINRRIIWGIGIFFISMLAAILIYSFAQLGTGSTEQGDISKTLDKVDFTKLFSNTWVNIFIGVNVVLGLILFDHYLSNKRKNMMGR